MAAVREIVGLKFHHLTVLQRLPRDPSAKTRMVKVLARCDCGSEKPYFVGNLRVGNTKSCGCDEFSTKPKNAPAPPREYAAWRNMKQHCLNPKHGCYDLYGGRGITVCELWVSSFARFLQDMGKCPDGYALGRSDIDREFGPGNCLWIDRKTLATMRRKRQP